jgi:signal transduction histidine kinase
MLNLRAQPLRRQLLFAILLFLAPILVSAAWLGVQEYRGSVDELTEQTNAAALRTAATIQRELVGLDRGVLTVTVNPAVRNLDSAVVERLLQPRLQRQWVGQIALLDRDGRLVSRAIADFDIPIEGARVIAPVVNSGMRVVSPLEISHSGRTYLTVAYPVRNASDALVGVLVYYVDPQRFETVFGRSLLPAGSVVALSEIDGRVLARSPNSPTYVAKELGVSFRNVSDPPQELDDVDGIRRMVGQAMVDSGPWIVTVGIPMSVAFDRATSLWSRALPALGLVLGGWLVLTFMFSRRLTGSLGHLESAAQRIGAGDFSPIEQRPMATREFASLQQAFDQMLRRFNETRAALDAQMAEERRMRQEVESLQRQIIRQERLAAVGQLVSGVAHEINNPLQAILGFAELLQMQGDLPESVTGDLVLIQKESARACTIIRNLAMFARQQTGEAGPVRLGDVIQSVTELRQRRLESENIELRIQDNATQPVLAVLAELQQVVLNFVVNAEQAIVLSGRQPGRITLRTRDHNDRVILEVEDTGPGVDPEHEAKLFQPFFTTKPVGQGTGLGLSVSYGIVDSIGGHIGYRSAPSGGAVFYFDLPGAQQ